MAAPLLIVIQGAPGVGKTTILEGLRQKLDLPMLGKDEVKEFLFDTLPQKDRDFSRLQGGTSFEMLYAFARIFLRSGRSVVIEGAFMTEFARPALLAMLKETGARYLEVFCFVDETVRQSRFDARVKNGKRHPAHLDGETGAEQPRPSSPYGTIGLGDVITVDTSTPMEEQFGVILPSVRERLA